jgi:hypothetical protein
MHETVFVLRGPQIGRQETEIVSTGVEIVIGWPNGDGFCDDERAPEAGRFLC